MLTLGEHRSLAAVQAGLVRRIYNAKGNTLVGPPGIASHVLWRLDKRKLIEDGPDPRRAGTITTCVQVCTAAGREELAAHQDPAGK
jgi:hypothetical protein